MCRIGTADQPGFTTRKAQARKSPATKQGGLYREPPVRAGGVDPIARRTQADGRCSLRSTEPEFTAGPGLLASVSGRRRLDAAAESEALNDRERLLMQQELRAQRHDQHLYRIAPFDALWSAYPSGWLDAANADEDVPTRPQIATGGTPGRTGT